MSSSSKGRVLVVDDEARVRLLLGRELGDRGFEVATSGDPEGAVKQVLGGSFDVVITDLKMPGIDGLELTRRVRSLQPRTEVILMTGYASLATAAEGMRLGAYDYITKPFGDLELVASSVSRAREKQCLAERTLQLEQRLAHSDRLAAIGQLAAGVAHEINNPMSFVSANMAVMRDAMADLRRLLSGIRDFSQRADPRGAAELGGLLTSVRFEQTINDFEEMIEDNLEGVQRVSAIVTDLRTFARIDREDVELVRIDQVLETAVNIARSEIRHRARLVKSINEVHAVPGHRGKLAQVVVNLLVNAAHAMADPSSPANKIVVGCGQDADHVYFTVEDNGRGMSPEVRRRIFEPFFTTKPRGTGTGLGLSLSAEIVRQHNGELSVESEMGQGSCLKVRLPIDTGLVPKNANTPVVRPLEKRRLRVLVIDDEPLLLSACRRMLSQRHDVAIAHDGGEALAILDEDDQFDVILCDLMMPGIDGAKFYEALEADRPELCVRVLFCSGGAVTPNIKEFASTLGSRLLEKPFTAEELIEGLERTAAQASAAA